jgi:hypothetical protein
MLVDFFKHSIRSSIQQQILKNLFFAESQIYFIFARFNLFIHIQVYLLELLPRLPIQLPSRLESVESTSLSELSIRGLQIIYQRLTVYDR